MRKIYKYRLLGNKTTFSKADEWLLLCQRLYNIALEQRIYIYRYNKKTISYYAQSKQLPELKEAFPEYQLVGSQVLQDVIQRLDKDLSLLQNAWQGLGWNWVEFGIMAGRLMVSLTIRFGNSAQFLNRVDHLIAYNQLDS